MTREEQNKQELINELKEKIKGKMRYADILLSVKTIEEISKALEQEPKILNTIDFAIDASNGDTNYFVGFRNGLRYAKSLIDGEEEPQFERSQE